MKNSYIIAEAGVNHNGQIDLAKKLVDVAAEAGADAVKFQTFKAEKLVTKDAEQADYQKKNSAKVEAQFEMLKRLELDDKAHQDVYDHCQEKGIDFLSTPFDEESLNFLVHKFNMPVVKIASGEITNAPFLLDIARTRRDIILSTGMSTLEDIEKALQVLAYGLCVPEGHPSWQELRENFSQEKTQKVLQEKLRVLHCTTEYPAPFDEVNMLAMKKIQETFQVPVGYSDHTQGILAPVVAASLGACVIEKHFTLDRNMEGPDHKASLEPRELKEMVRQVRLVEKMLGAQEKMVTESELKNRSVARKSLILAREVSQGQPLKLSDFTAQRPGDGLSPMDVWDYIGTKAPRDFDKGERFEQ